MAKIENGKPEAPKKGDHAKQHAPSEESAPGAPYVGPDRRAGGRGTYRGVERRTLH